MGALDVIITGIVRDVASDLVRQFTGLVQTEAPHATAWNGYKYIGRIRPSDGLVVLLREPVCDLI